MSKESEQSEKMFEVIEILMKLGENELAFQIRVAHDKLLRTQLRNRTMAMIFKVAPDYTLAYHGTQNLPEWAGKTLREFTNAMGRPHDSVETYEIACRTIREYRWGE